MKPYVYSLLAIIITCCSAQAMEIPFALTIQQANQFLQKPELTDKASFTTIQAHERDLSTITKKARDLLPSLDQRDQQTVTNWIQKIGNKNKPGIQELKTIIYNAYLPQHPDELCREISHIIPQLGNSTPMKHYYHTDITTLAGLLKKQIDDTEKINIIDNLLSTLRNEPSSEQDRAQIMDYFASICKEIRDKKTILPAPEPQEIIVLKEKPTPISAALLSRGEALDEKFKQEESQTTLPPMEKFTGQPLIKPQKGLVEIIKHLPEPKEQPRPFIPEARNIDKELEQKKQTQEIERSEKELKVMAKAVQLNIFGNLNIRKGLSDAWTKFNRWLSSFSF